MQMWRVLATLVAALSFSQQASAHAIDQTYLFMKLNGNEIGGRFEMTTADLNAALGTNFPLTETPDAASLDAEIERIEAYMRRHVDFSIDGDPLPFVVTRPRSSNMPATSSRTAPPPCPPVPG